MTIGKHITDEPAETRFDKVFPENWGCYVDFSFSDGDGHVVLDGKFNSAQLLWLAADLGRRLRGET